MVFCFILQTENGAGIQAAGNLTPAQFNILEAIRKFSNKTILIYSSTNKVYGDLENYKYTEKKTRYIIKNDFKGFTEKNDLDFKSPYACSKGSADQYVLDYSRVYNLNTVVFRHSSVYG